MSDEDFQKEVKDLVDMLNDFHRIKDRGLNKWLKVEIKEQIRKLLEE